MANAASSALAVPGAATGAASDALGAGVAEGVRVSGASVAVALTSGVEAEGAPDWGLASEPIAKKAMRSAAMTPKMTTSLTLRGDKTFPPR